MSRRMDTIIYSLVIISVILGVYGNKLKIVDLTHEHGPSTLYWPGAPTYNFTILTREQLQHHWFEVNYFGTAEHGGTHLDAPAHFFRGRARASNIPMEKLGGPGVIINVEEKARENPDYQVAIEDIQQWEEKYGRIPDGAVVIMNSGWHKKYPNKKEVFNTLAFDDPGTFHYPGWHEKATEWLAANRNVNIVGVDTPSTDFGQTKSFPSHVTLAKNNICGLEFVANLDEIPEQGTMIFAAVIKLKDGSGGPARVFAVIGDILTSINRNIDSKLKEDL